MSEDGDAAFRGDLPQFSGSTAKCINHLVQASLSLSVLSLQRSENDTEMKFNPLNHLKDLNVTDIKMRVEGEQGGMITVQFRLSCTLDRLFCRYLNQLSPAQVHALIIEKSSVVMSPAVVASELTNSEAERFILKPGSTNRN